MLVVGVYSYKDDGNYAPLYPGLMDIPELESAPDGTEQDAGVSDAALEVSPGGDGLSASDAVAFNPPDTRTQITQASRATYNRTTVTGEKVGPPTIDDGVPGKGRDFGSVVHLVFEDAILGRLPADPRPYIRSLCDQAGLDGRPADDILAMLERLRTSELWRDLASAEVVYTEVPVGILDQGKGETPALVRGKIDLIYRTTAGWKIVDFKTDVDASAGTLPLVKPHYASQVQRYAEYWREVTGEPVIHCALYGTVGDGGLLEVPPVD